MSFSNKSESPHGSNDPPRPPTQNRESSSSSRVQRDGNFPSRTEKASTDPQTRLKTTTPERGNIPQNSGDNHRHTSWTGLLKKFFSDQNSALSEGQSQRDLEAYIESLQADIQHKDTELNKSSQIHKNQIRTLNDKLKSSQAEVRYLYTEVEKYRQDIGIRDYELLELKQEIQKSREEKLKMQDSHNQVIRGIQEAAFKRMESGRWAPIEDSRIMSDVDRLNKAIRAWARKASIADVAALIALEQGDQETLSDHLSSVAVLAEGKLPAGLLTPRLLYVLLNAILAHKVYESFFGSPFFFLVVKAKEDMEDNLLCERLDTLYRETQESNPQDAHLWRTQMLRSLLPPLTNITNREKTLRVRTEDLISRVARHQASKFLKSPARHLISRDFKESDMEKLASIFHEAANLSYRLWTRRTAMKCSGLRELGTSTFDVDDNRFKPHGSVKYSEHEDKLKGRPITVIVHPLLEVYGTDEGEDYDQARVWAPAEVWLDSQPAPKANAQ